MLHFTTGNGGELPRKHVDWEMKNNQFMKENKRREKGEYSGKNSEQEQSEKGVGRVRAGKEMKAFKSKIDSTT